MGVVLFAGSQVALPVPVTDNQSRSALLHENLVLVQDFGEHSDLFYRDWNRNEGIHANALNAFTHFVTESNFDSELSNDELRAYRERFVDKIMELSKEDNLVYVTPESDELAQKLAIALWKIVVRKALEDEKPEVTEALVAAVNNDNLGFTVGLRTGAMNTSFREVQNQLGSRMPDEVQFDEPKEFSGRRLDNIPDSFDSREKWPLCKEVFTRAHNQGECGSCWAFAATHALDSRLCIATGGDFSGTKAMLSRTFITACSGYNDGCQGGWPTEAMDLVANHGVPLGGDEGCIPYFGTGGGRDHFDVQSRAPPCPNACKNSYSRPMSADLFSVGQKANHMQYSYSQPGSQSSVKIAIMTEGPVVGVVHVDNAFFAYQSGVYNSGCNSGLNHGIGVIGWGSEAGRPFWTIVNSWGAEDFGQMKVAPCVLQVVIVPSSMNQPPRSVPEPMFAGASPPMFAGASPPMFAGASPPSTSPPSNGYQDEDEEESTPFKVLSGACTIDKEGCVRSPRHPEMYPDDGMCDIKVSRPVSLEVEDFNVEKDYDYIRVDGAPTKYTGAKTPNLVEAKSSITWTSDYSAGNTGWVICAAKKLHPDQPTYKAKCTDSGDDIAEPHGTQLLIECRADCTRGALWGTNKYTRDSHICSAGQHAIGSNKFKLKFIDGETDPGVKRYEGSTRNGVQSSSYWRRWPEAYEVSEA